eukprot:SAG11_NODE_6753_length_1253_cov_3.454939_2_plen_56_part_01
MSEASADSDDNLSIRDRPLDRSSASARTTTTATSGELTRGDPNGPETTLKTSGSDA